jgi:hypothetical protein
METDRLCERADAAIAVSRRLVHEIRQHVADAKTAHDRLIASMQELNRVDDALLRRFLQRAPDPHGLGPSGR